MGKGRRADVIALVVGVLVPPVLTVLLIPFRDRLGITNVALILMAVVVGVATTGRRAAAVAAALSAALSYDFFHAEPFGTLRVDRREDLVSMVLLVAAGLIVVELARWGQRQRGHAERTVGGMSALRSIAEMVAIGEDPRFVVLSASFWLREILHLQDCRFEELPLEAPRTILQSDGTVTVGRLRWATYNQGLPGPEVHLAVRHGATIPGYFVLMPTPGQPVTEDQLFTAAAIADQVGASYAAHQTDR